MQRCLRLHTPLPRTRLQAAVRTYSTQPDDGRLKITRVRLDDEYHGSWSELTRGLGAWKSTKDDRFLAGVDTRAPDFAQAFLNTKVQLKQWRHAMIYLLSQKPDHALNMLVRTRHTNIPAHWITDTLQFLLNEFSAQDEEVARVSCSKLVASLKSLLRAPLVFDQAFIPLLMPHLSQGEIKEIWSYIRDGKISVPWDAHCRLARYFAWREEIPEAVDAFIGGLGMRKESGHDHGGDDRVLTGTLLIIIRQLVSRPDGYRESVRLCENLKPFGINMNIMLVNFLLRHAADREQYDVLSELYSLLVPRTRPDWFTTTILLKAYQARPDKAIPLSTIIDDALTYDTISDKDTVANLLLHTIITEALRVPEEAWTHICSLYSRMFSTSPLVELGLPIEVRSGRPPTADATAYMVKAFLKIHAFGFLQDVDPVDVYKTWHSLAQSGAQPFRQMASTDHTYNSFLTEFIRKRESLINATDIIRDMQADFEGNSKPTVYSWNIFLLGLQLHNKPELAQQVLQYMINHGIQPDNVTWNTLISDFAFRQDIDGLLDQLQRAEQAGHEFDEFTEKGIQKVANQSKLRTALRKNLDFSDELKSGLQARFENDDNNHSNEADGTREPDAFDRLGM